MLGSLLKRIWTSTKVPPILHIEVFSRGQLVEVSENAPENFRPGAWALVVENTVLIEFSDNTTVELPAKFLKSRGPVMLSQ